MADSNTIKRYKFVEGVRVPEYDECCTLTGYRYENQLVEDPKGKFCLFEDISSFIPPQQ